MGKNINMRSRVGDATHIKSVCRWVRLSSRGNLPNRKVHAATSRQTLQRDPHPQAMPHKRTTVTMSCTRCG